MKNEPKKRQSQAPVVGGRQIYTNSHFQSLIPALSSINKK